MRSHYHGFRKVFDGWQVAAEVVAGGSPAVESHYKQLSAKFGYAIQTPEPLMNNLGYQLMGAGKMDEAIAVFNRAGEALSRHGLKFFYHTHGYEFQPHGNGTLFDLMMAGTKPEFVRYEMDVFWIVHPGQDPVKLLEKYGSRFELMHVKDMKKGTQTGDLTGNSDVKNDVTLGTGMMDWPAILKAAQRAGVKWYFIEDESPASAQQIPLSLRYLERVKF
jgi:sugar phosphate isomerase/epimerase